MTQDELRSLVEQQHQLEELAKHPGWEVLEDYALHGPAGSLARQRGLVNGGAKDWESYIRECGWLSGAHHVLNARETVAQMVATAREQLGESDSE